MSIRIHRNLPRRHNQVLRPILRARPAGDNLRSGPFMRSKSLCVTTGWGRGGWPFRGVDPQTEPRQISEPQHDGL